MKPKVNDILKRGAERFQLVGYKGDLMLLKPLNIEALYNDETVDPEMIKLSIKAGYKPSMGSIVQLHLKYSNTFEIDQGTT